VRKATTVQTEVSRPLAGLFPLHSPRFAHGDRIALSDSRANDHGAADQELDRRGNGDGRHGDDHLRGKHKPVMIQF